jgi:DNA-binding protein H-NS
MAQTYAQLQKQIDQLQHQANRVRDEEAQGVIERIKAAIAVYGLTAEQLGFGAVARPAELTAPTPKPAPQKALKPATKGKSNPHFGGFSDRRGNVWSGRGPHPAWLRDALQAGHDKNEFRLGSSARPTKTLLSLPSAAPAVVASTPAIASPANASRKSPTVSYADDAGHAWSGMGPMPSWLKTRIAAGKSLADFAR